MSVEPVEAMKQALGILRRYWRYPEFRPGQQEAVEAVLAGRDVLAIMPTGGGKSVCYQVPSMLREGLTLVISPLIALMQDQVTQLNARGIPAAFINSTLSARDIDQRWTDAEFGRYRLLYLAPERLQSEVFLARAGRLEVSLLAVDEAHCISEWGHHFRPSYLQIAQVRRMLGNLPTLAVTATATPEVRLDIVEHLALHDPAIIVKGFDRPNLVWSIFRTENKQERVQSVLHSVNGSGILYAATRRNVETWAEKLTRQGETVAIYHGGLSTVAREKAQQDWLEGRVRLVVATNAFGMGIDKPDVRFVLHLDIPASLEAYYQEAGRAGRDGERAFAVLLYAPRDEATQRALIEEGHPDAKSVAQVYDAACNLAQISVGAMPEAPVTLDLDTMVKVTGFSPIRVTTAIELLTRQGTWQALPTRRHHGLIRFLLPGEAIRRYADSLQNKALARFVRVLLRTVHADAFSNWWDIDLRLLERRTRLSRPRLLRGLAFLEGHRLIGWRAPDKALRVQFNEARAQRLPVDDLAVRRARRRAESRWADMLRYAGTVTCRRHFLLAYFGEKSPSRCGNCDICMGRHRAVVILPEDEPLMRHILRQVAGEIPRAQWFEPPPPSEQHVDGLIDWLMQEGFLRITSALDEAFTVTDKALELMDQWEPRTRRGDGRS
ncbi:MAG: ATP-dependent DNA helicase RecQ [Rhodothermales bacterium]